ncbi:MAG: T9SS type A sorting domain-containing protein [Taibaiella sp.]|nr:T9SS type A sorting domain-containing protein [Taibaiella sp.]
MKKLILFGVAAAFSAGAYAQAISSSLLLGKDRTNNPTVDNIKAVGNATVHAANAPAGGNLRTTALPGRWYDYFSTKNLLLGSPFTGTTPQTAFLNTWQSANIKQTFSTGPGTVNYLSSAQVIAPDFFSYNDSNLLNTLYGISNGSSLLYIDTRHGYEVDSISVNGTYLRVKKSRLTPDSLIISVAPSTGYYYFPKATYTFVPTYTTQDTLFAYAPFYVDSIRKIASSATAATKMTWSVPLTAAMGDTLSSTGTVSIHAFTFALPTPLQIPPGSNVAVSVTFKSTDSWTAADSVEEYNRFLTLFGYENTSGHMTYAYGADRSDRNGAGLMFSSDSAHYIPSIAIQGFNPTGNFRYQYSTISAFMKCDSCAAIQTSTIDNPGPVGGVAVKNVTSNITSISAFPNPAVNELTIPFTLAKSGNVTVTITNAIGQVTGRQNFNNISTGKAVFNTSAYASGLYFYTLQVDGQRYTDRVVVSH